jgi:hypothetical protein
LEDEDAIDVAAVNLPSNAKENWTLVPLKKFRADGGEVAGTMSGPPARNPALQVPGPDVMIQALADDSFNKVCVDSGAGESVCPVEAFPSYKTVTTPKTGTIYKAAGGQKLTNVGEIRPCFKPSGIGGSMAFQATTDVQKPLAAASKIAAKGNRIVLEAEGSDSYIENKQSGKRIPLTLENGVYMMEMLVVPFQGQTIR